mmetsp:Transcript_21577/g.24211  ORF Transcript_21577/g.24211 Transcript_21577/m.24211 type:complete len:89 (+) Transcript_21577:146-412(+)
MTSTTRNNDPALRQTNSNEDYDDDDDPWVLTDGGGIDQEKRPELYQFNIFQENEDDDDDIVLVVFSSPLFVTPANKQTRYPLAIEKRG